MTNLKSIAKVFGAKLKTQAEKDPSFYFFSPDETTSNKLDEIYQSNKARVENERKLTWF